MRKSKVLVISYGLVLTGLLITSLGLKCNIQGTRPGNINPVIKFANIPEDGTTFTSQPVVYWFGKDVDGFVAKYQYIVFKASQIQLLGYGVDSLGVDTDFVNFLESIPDSFWIVDLTKWGKTLDSLGEEVIVPVELVTIVGAGQTNDEIQLFASANPNVIILQFLFLRAVDNVSATSNVIYRTFSRTNHPPNSKIEFDNQEIYYSLSDTTRTWKGIPIAWGGSDSLDYPLGEPPLEFSWKLFYLGTSESDTLSPDTSNLLAVSYDPNDGDEWVKAKGTILPAGLETGYHMFRVQSRDDAFIEDASPAQTIFYVIKPSFDKEILIVDITKFGATAYGEANNPNLYRIYYTQMLANANHPAESLWQMAGDVNFTPDERLLSQYKLVIVVNQDRGAGIADPLARQLIKYLDVGGNLWIMGVGNFTTSGSFKPSPRGLKTFLSELSTALSAGESGFNIDVGKTYCGLERYFMPFWDGNRYPDSTCSGGSCTWHQPPWPNYPAGRNEEFSGANRDDNPIFSSWPLLLETDSAQVMTANSPPAINDKYLFYDKVPHVNYIVTYSIHPDFPDLPKAETIYKFNSAYGGASVMHGKPVAVRYQGPTFRTAVFTFPLSFIKMSQSVELTKQMLNWFGIPTAS